MSGPFGNCKNAPLHQSDSVQAGAAVWAIDANGRLSHASSNLAEQHGWDLDLWLGEPVAAWPALARLCPEAEASDSHFGQIRRVEDGPLPAGDLVTHRHAGHRVYEWFAASPTDEARLQRPERLQFLQTLAGCRSARQAAELLLDWVAKTTGFDRCMLYQFGRDWHGEVMAERLRPNVNGFLGLRFPAGDLPANARRLYQLNWQRLIADVDAPDVPLLSRQAQPLDLTYGQSRAVHPVHIQYLKNIGVSASFSLSIVVEGRLWALIACHHLMPHPLPPRLRSALEELARLTALSVGHFLQSEREQDRASRHELLGLMRGQLAQSEEFGMKAVASQLPMLAKLFRTQGFVLAESDGLRHNLQQVDDGGMRLLGQFLDGLPRDMVSTWAQVPPALAADRGLARCAAGGMFVPLGSREHLCLLRHEQLETVTWAGRPTSTDEADTSPAALTPRASFAAWAETVKGQAAVWSDVDLAFADQLRSDLFDHLGQSQLRKVAWLDPLTGLSNRLQFDRRLDQQIRHSLKHGELFALMMLDLDKFKPVNDTLGHAAGDQLLVEVGRRLTGLVRQSDTVARLGGDEFAIIQAGITSTEASSHLARRVIEALGKPFEIQDQTVNIGASVGVSMCPMHSMDAGELMEGADLALYRAKHGGRATFELFDSSMQEGADRRRSLQIELNAALAGQQFEMIYQPVVDLHSGQVLSLEAFCRWRHPDGRILPASEFWGQVERFHLSVSLGALTLQQAFRDVAGWRQAGLGTPTVAVNVSAKQFLAQDLLAQVEQLAAVHELPLTWLRLDVKQEGLMHDLAAAERKILALRARGVLVNLDGFGTGFVALDAMARLQIDALKVHGGLFRTPATPQQSALLTMALRICEVLHLRATATQLGSEENLALARQRGFELGQGHVIAPPMAQNEVRDLLTPGAKVDFGGKRGAAGVAAG